jgi:outer membrane receptor protein involved in Fe transport
MHTNLSWRGIVQYDVNPDMMIYGTAARGYKGPGFSEFSVRYVRARKSPPISKRAPRRSSSIASLR